MRYLLRHKKSLRQFTQHEEIDIVNFLDKRIYICVNKKYFDNFEFDKILEKIFVITRYI